jgi:hypothetical protein
MRPVDHTATLPPTGHFGALRREANRLWTVGYLMAIAPTVERLEDRAKALIDRLLDWR